MKLPYCKKPCSNCPFRNDGQGVLLNEERIKEILKQDSFVCHKSVYDSNIQKKSTQSRLQCAGHMTIKGNDNGFVRLAKRMGLETPIKNQQVLFNSEQDLINHHKR